MEEWFTGRTLHANVVRVLSPIADWALRVDRPNGFEASASLNEVR